MVESSSSRSDSDHEKIEYNVETESPVQLNHVQEELADLEQLQSLKSEPPVGTTMANVGPPPDGGLHAWLQVAGGFFILFNTWGYVNAFAVFENYYSQTLLPTTSPSTISWIGSIAGFLIMVSTLIAGRLVDMGFLRFLLVGGSFFMVFGVMMMSISKEFYQLFLSEGVCFGLGASMAFITAVTTVASYFTTKRSRALGVTTSGSSLGGVLYPIMAHRLIESVGFPWAARIMGFVMLATLSISCLVLRRRVPPRVTGPIIDWASFKDVPFMCSAFGMFFAFAGVYVFIFFCVTYGSHIGTDASLTPYIVAILNAASVFGRLIPNIVADKLGPLNVITPCVLICMILSFGWIAVKSTASLIVITALYGFFQRIHSLPTTINFCIANPGAQQAGCEKWAWLLSSLLWSPNEFPRSRGHYTPAWISWSSAVWRLSLPGIGLLFVSSPLFQAATTFRKGLIYA